MLSEDLTASPAIREDTNAFDRTNDVEDTGPMPEMYHRRSTSSQSTTGGLRLGSAERHEVDHVLTLQLQQELQRRADARLLSSCTFRPKINGKRSVSPQQSSKVEDRLLLLGQMAKEKVHRETMIHQDRALDLLSFTPQIDSVSRQKARSMHPGGVPVVDRLLHYGRVAAESKAVLEHRLREEEDKQMAQTFNHATALSKKTKGTFLARCVTKENDKKQAIARKRAELLVECTFAPSISKVSREYCEITRGEVQNNNLRVEELYQDAHQRRKVQQQREDDKAATEMDRHMTHPKTNVKSQQVLFGGSHQSFYSQEFIQRQQVFQQLAKEHSKQLKQQLEAEATNKPKLLERVTSELIQEQVVRLHYQSVDISKDVKKQLAKTQLEEACPFRPQLSIGSEECVKRIERNPNVVERLTRESRYKRRSASANDAIRRNEQEKSNEEFLHKKIVKDSDAEEFYQRQMFHVQQRDELLRHKKLTSNMSDQVECTFHPNIEVGSSQQRQVNNTPSTIITPPTGTNKVPAGPPRRQQLGGSEDKNRSSSSHVQSTSFQGVERHVERQQKAQQMKRDEEERRNQLGKGMPCNGPKYTILSPFSLSRSRTNHRLQQEEIHHGSNTPLTEVPLNHHLRSMQERGRAQEKYADPFTSEQLLAAIRKYNQR